ncbi:peptidylprolyl isomerase [Ramlibacter albus]|uniref:peptidylprolyl isomerase n=1 Tax=Ramlibacter albus TaxID=2079448 RepID=A0A923M986_9BURK|nr:peptidylprolyl isomerase [Ramlibacter albus]MBC5765221.1 peptidylprolyl isomerase [Ramlibacter albus]
MKTFTRLLARVACTALLLFAGALHAQTSLVRLHTTQGPIDMQMLSGAPVTVANFLAYVRGGDYTDSLVHRSAYNGTTPFVIQGGGFRWTEAGCCTTVPSRGAIVNEFSATRSNVRGTVAMAKNSGDPNSATSQWFINMGNNAANLDNQNGGFTVFARVTTPGLAVADSIAALPRVNLQNVFTELPVANWQPGTPVLRSNAVRVTEVTELSSATSSDRIFNYLEAAFPQFLAPQKATTGQALGYVFRYYAGTNAYVATKDGQVWVLLLSITPNLVNVGSIDTWLGVAQTAGY